MADELDPVKIPVEVEVDPSSLKEITAEAKRAEQAVKNLTAAAQKLNDQRAQGSQRRGTAQPKTHEEQLQGWETQRQRRMQRLSYDTDPARSQDRFEEYRASRARLKERQEFERRLAPDSHGGMFGHATSMHTLTSLAGGNAQPLISALSRSLMNTVAGAAGGGLMGAAGLGLGMAGAAGAGYLFYNSQVSGQIANQYALGASVGGTKDVRQLASDLIGASSNFNQGHDVAQQVAQAMGGGGMQASQVNGNTQSVLALAALTGQKPDQFTGMTTAMSVGGGMSHQDIAQSFGELYQQTRDGKISLDALVQSLKTLQQQTGGLALDYKGVAQLAAAQRAVGPGVNIGAMMAPGMHATGTNQIGIAEALGIGVDQMAGWQGQLPGVKANPMALFRTQANRLAQLTAGYSGQMRRDTEQTLAPSLGLDLSGMSGLQQTQYLNAINSGDLQRAMQIANPPPPAPIKQPGQHAADRSTSLIDKAKSKVGNAVDTFANDPAGTLAHVDPHPPRRIPKPFDVSPWGMDILGAAGNAMTNAGNWVSNGGPFGGSSQKVDLKVQLEHHITVSNGSATVTSTVKGVDPKRTGKGHVNVVR